MTPSNCLRSFVVAAISVSPCLAAGCSSEPEPTVDMCGIQVPESHAQKYFDGDLYIVSRYVENGRSASEMAAGLALTMVLNGIDFANPKYKFEFSNGDYSYKSGDTGYTLSLYFAKDVDGFKSGDKIALDVFDVGTFVKNIHARILPEPEVTFDKGPLTALIEGDVDFDIKSPLDVKVKVRLKPELVAFELKSVGVRRGRAPRADDTFTWHLGTTRATLVDVVDQVKAGTYGLKIDDSRYRSVYFNVEQDFGESKFLVKQEGDRYHFEGAYEAELRAHGQTLYQVGTVASRSENSTAYYCDAAHVRRLGVAHHSQDLESGTFVFDQGGRKHRYSLGSF